MFQSHSKTWLVFLFLTLQNYCYAANILAIIPTPSFSHQIPFRPLWKELLQRGHNLTLVTTDPIKDPSLKNLTEIDMSYGYKYMEKHKFADVASNDSKSFYEIGLVIRQATNDSNNDFFRSPEGQNLIHNKDNRFDLLIVEAQLPAMMIFSWWYQVPFIGVSSLDCSAYFHDAVGNPTHPVTSPDNNLSIENLEKMSFWERLQSFLYTNIFKSIIYYMTFPKERLLLKHYFGEEVPPLREVLNNMSMLFIATNPIFHTIRPLMPNTITIGNGMHINPPKSLPKDIKEFLDNAKDGAVYFSLGSNIKGRNLNESTKAELLKAFTSLPYRILWKIDEEFKNLPENVKTGKWFSQQDVLEHSNVKAFITQGGLQSMQESVYFDKPMIGISFFGDQHMNVKRMIHFGYGVSVYKHNITEQSIREAVREVITNPKYSEKVKEYGNIFRDVDIPNVKKAAWWTEYVIRHKGVKHFRNPMLDMPFWKIYMLDVAAVVFSALLLTFIVLYKLFQLVLKIVALGFRLVFRKSSKKADKRKKES